MSKSEQEYFRWLELPATMESFPELQRFISEGAHGAQLADEQVGKVELIFEELVTNVIRHGYPPGESGTVRVGYSVGPRAEFRSQIRSGGIPFNPLLKPDLELSEDVSQRVPGGLGIHLVKNLADEISYDYAEGVNVISWTVLP